MDITMELKELKAIGLNADEMACLNAIAREYKRACKKHPDWPTDIIHQAAIVNEESGELIRAALQQGYESGNWEATENEAKQTGAMALRFMVNMI